MITLLVLVPGIIHTVVNSFEGFSFLFFYSPGEGIKKNPTTRTLTLNSVYKGTVLKDEVFSLTLYFVSCFHRSSISINIRLP